MRLFRLASLALPVIFAAGGVLAAVVTPRSGDWEGTAEFGTIDFTVRDDGTAITKIKYYFERWRCGPVTRSGGVTISRGSGWPISNNRIDISNMIDLNLTITITGTFNAAGNKASGDWVADSYGTECSGTWQATPVGGGNLAPTAIFTADPMEGPAPLTVNFDASDSNDPDGSIQSYAWDFGDGASSSGVTTSHTYETADTYEATLTVTDNNGATASASETITVSSQPTRIVDIRHFDPSDTQWLWLAESTTPYDSGFVFGTNHYGDQAKATALPLPSAESEGRVTEVKVWFAYRRAGLTNQTYQLEILNGDPATGPVGDPLYGESFLLAQVNADDDPETTSDATIHTIDPPVLVGSTFFVCVNFGSYGPDDWGDAAIVATGAQDHRVPEVWEKWDDGSWHNVSDAWFANDDDGAHMWIEASVQFVGVNSAPTVVQGIDDRYLNPRGAVFQQDLTQVFSDPDGDALAFSATSSDASVAAVSVTNDVLKVTAGANGPAEITVTASDGRGGTASTSFSVVVNVAIDASAEDLPQEFALYPNYPNPFNPTTTISYDLPRLSVVTLTVYDLLGRRVTDLASGRQPAGKYEVSFDATDLPSGVYVYRLAAGEYVKTRRMVVVR